MSQLELKNVGKHSFNYNDFENLNIEKHKEYLDNCIDLECETKNKWRPIHFICRNSTPEMITFIIKKGVALECKTKDKWRPVHLICRFSTPEMIKFIFENGVELECETNNGWKPIHFICRSSTLDVIEYASSKCDLTAKIHKYGDKTVNYDIYDLMKLNPLITKQPTLYDNIKTFFNNIIS